MKEFDKTKTYHIGDKVTINGKEYEFVIDWYTDCDNCDYERECYELPDDDIKCNQCKVTNVLKLTNK